jgi:BASS family bile acid:Na+ symporter
MSESTLDLLQGLLITGTLWAAGVGLGSSVKPGQVLASLRRAGLLGRVTSLDLVLVPAIMWLSVSLLVSDEDVGTGLLLVAFASAGPLGIKLASRAGGDVAYAIGLVVMLELANVVVVPVWAALLGIAASPAVVLDILRTLVLLVLLPIATGLAIGSRRPAQSRRWAALLDRISDVGVIAIVALLLARHSSVVGDALGTGAPVAVLLFVMVALAAGWMVGGPGRDTRAATSLVTGVRANGAAVAIAASAFAAEPAVGIGVIIAGLGSVVLPSLLALGLALVTSRPTPWRGRTRPDPWPRSHDAPG